MELYMLTAILTMAAVWDLFHGKIPNVLIVSGYILAFCNVLMQSAGQFDRLLGLILPLLMGYVFFAIGILGAGDAKLLSVTGAFLGVKEVLHCIGGAIVVGAVIGGIKLVIKTGRQRRYPQGMTIRFALPVLCGTMYRLFVTMTGFDWLRGWR